MDSVTITWNDGIFTIDEIETSQNKLLNERGYYAILSGTSNRNTYENITLLYIGKAFDQSLRERISQPHDAYNCIKSHIDKNPKKEVLFMIGRITKSSTKRLTQELINDVECCLIFTNKPMCNTQCKNSYSGREILVKNEGDYSPLNQQSNCQ